MRSPAGSVPAAGERHTADRPDEKTGPQIHLMYVLPADGADQELDIDGTVAASFGAAEGWLSGQTGGRTLRLDTFEGEPDISFITLSRPDDDVQAEGAFGRDLIEGELREAGFDSAEKVYAVYYDGGSTYACGSGAYPPRIVGNVAVLWLHGLPLSGAIRCGDNEFAEGGDDAGFWEYVAVHEIMHTLGFVPTCSPNETLDGHISGPANDLMYEGEEESDLPKALDAGNDDYYRTDIVGCPDFEDSPYLTP
ncbi:MAG: hypothetical protein WD472_07645 [Dehalococcoidia bacterium]